VDATGTLVGGGNGFIWWDAGRSVAWAIDPETGLALNVQGPTYYATTDCSGPGYAAALLPRTPFRARGETTWRLRPDTMKTTTLAAKSWVYTAGCQAITSTIAAIPLDSSTLPAPALIEPPAFVPPLHQELR